MTSFAEVLHQLKELSNNTAEQGRRFEILMKSFLQKDPRYKSLFSDVWLWDEWPDRRGRDTGIDLVAKEKDGGNLWAIQCKFYAPSHRLQKSDIDSFLATSGQRTYKYRMIISTTNLWSNHAEESIDNQRIPCIRLTTQDLEKCLVDWGDISKGEVKTLKSKKLHSYQKEAVEKVVAGLQKDDRGKLIMACGTGKTITALRIAERMYPNGGRILLLAPSISLLSQNIREWAYNKKTKHRYQVVCSDTGVGKDKDENYMRLKDLAYPATTNSKDLAQQIDAEDKSSRLNVMFSTYQSLDVLTEAQSLGAPEFDLVICDEAHRTVGATKKDSSDTPLFNRIHDNKYVKAHKRLYMTATPKIFSEAAAKQVTDAGAKFFSMNDSAVYGEELYRLSFGESVEKGYLTDYKVLILCVSQDYIAKKMPDLQKDENLNIPDVVKMVGCWRALTDKKTYEEKDGKKSDYIKLTKTYEDKAAESADAYTKENTEILSRSVAFFNRIADSKTFAKNMKDVVENFQDEHDDSVQFDIKHVDGDNSSMYRDESLQWLRDNTENKTECRILTNARCLSEGIDVPTLDAVLFMQPRRSEVDVVQSVGRVMRRSPNKKYGYIVLPVVAPEGEDAAKRLDKDKGYQTVWQVLRALRSHDNRLDVKVNQVDINEKKIDQIEVIGIDGEGNIVREDTSGYQTGFDFEGMEKQIYATLVKKCGDRFYWEEWAKDIAEIVERTAKRIEKLIEQKEEAAKKFNAFLKTLHKVINSSISEEDARLMIAQHMVTEPVFDALFSDYKFSQQNSVSRKMNAMLQLLEDFGLKGEMRDLQGFYDSVRRSVQGIDNTDGRQKIMLELYEKFFSTAFKKDAARLGIVYTPNEVVDFILHSADEVARKQFGEGLADKNVNILDPFSGTGIFIARFLQNRELINDAALEQKFTGELFAYEMVLLAYYIAAINIEEAYHSRHPNKNYLPFKGISLTDTFQLAERGDNELFTDDLNDGAVPRSAKKDIRIILGNPPYSAWQRSENDANRNLKYKKLDARIKQTYANLQNNKAQLRNSLYDSYIRAVRWASDRIGERGMIAFVTNAGFLESSTGAGLRKCLRDEFSKIYCLNLRGNARSSGEKRRKESDNVFGQGTRTPVAITILIKNPNSTASSCKILYRQLDDYMKRDEKLNFLKNKKSVTCIKDWQEIAPNEYHDWIEQRVEFPTSYIVLGDPKNKQLLNTKKKNREQSEQNAIDIEDKQPISLPEKSIFISYCPGVVTTRDKWAYNFNSQTVTENMQRTINFYDEQRKDYHSINPRPDAKDFINTDPSKISWDSTLIKQLERNKSSPYRGTEALRDAIYRPYVQKKIYFDRFYNSRTGNFGKGGIQKKMHSKNHNAPVFREASFLPQLDSQNLLMVITDKSAKSEFSVLMTDKIVDRGMLSPAQVFPLYYYDEQGEQHSNIPQATIDLFVKSYNKKSISAEDIFYYVYALLHWPAYKERYVNTLSKEFPKIPLLASYDSFCIFRDAGKKLADIHLNYETEEEYSLDEIRDLASSGKEHRKIEKKMKFAGLRESDKTQIVYNAHLTLAGIPDKAHKYTLCGKSPLRWMMDFYTKTIDKESGITDDVNAILQKDPDYLVSLIKRLVTVSVKTVDIIESFPDKLPD